MRNEDVEALRREGRLVLAEAHIMVIETSEDHGYMPNSMVAIYPQEARLRPDQQKVIGDMTVGECAAEIVNVTKCDDPPIVIHTVCSHDTDTRRSWQIVHGGCRYPAMGTELSAWEAAVIAVREEAFK